MMIPESNKNNNETVPAIARRSFLAQSAMLVGLSACLPYSPWGQAASAAVNLMSLEPVFKLETITPGIIVITGGGGNAVVFYDQKSKQALLSDCKNPHLGFTLRRRIEAAGYHLEKVINTHHHLDHSGGNYAFNHDLELIGHQNLTPRVRAQVATAIQRARAAIKSLPGAEFAADREKFNEMAARVSADDFTPDLEMTTPELEVKLNDSHAVELRHVTPGHTDNDIFLRFPTQNVIHTGDLLFHESHPFIDVSAGADTRGWQTSVKAIIELCDSETVVVPGHGEVTDVSGLKKQVTYFDDLREIVKDARGEGQSRAEIISLEPAIFADLKFERLQARNLGVVFDELAQEGQ